MKKMSTKLIVLLLAVALLFGCGIGGTVAWLVTQTDPVVNTFTIGNITIELTETFNAKSNSDLTADDIWQGKLIPGKKLAKDPKVTVKGGSEECWLFVKIDENNVTNYIEYAVADGWTKLNDSNSGVYYREVTASDGDQHFYVLKGEGEGDLAHGFVQIPSNITKTDMDTLATSIQSDSKNAPTLSFTAYAVQKENINTAADAWTQANNSANYPSTNP